MSSLKFGDQCIGFSDIVRKRRHAQRHGGKNRSLATVINTTVKNSKTMHDPEQF